MGRRLAAEALGTFWLVFAGCGSALLSAGLPGLGIGVFGIAFAFGVAVITIVYAIGHISGCHINPAVTVGLMVSKRFPAHEVPGYLAAQVLGGILAPGRSISSPPDGPGSSPVASPPTATATIPRPAIPSWPASAPKRSSVSFSS